jgi:hypothetical protein
MSFETTAELDLVVSDQALRQVRGQIESELGAIEIGATDGGTMSAQSAQSGSGGSRRQRQTLRMERTQTEHLEDIALYLESIDDVLSEGGLLGGGGGGGIFTEIIGAGAETAGDVGVEAGDAVADAVSDVLTGTVASALGNTISSAVAGSTVSVEPNPLPVESGDSGGNNVTVSPDVHFSPTIKPTFEPDFGPDINLPDLNFGIPDTLAVNREPLPVQRDPLPVEAIDPLPVEDVGPITVAFETRTGRSPTSTGSGSGSGPLGGVQLGGESGITLGPGGIQVGGDSGITLGRDPGDPTGTQSGSGGSTSASVSRREVTVTHSPTYNVDVDPRRLDSLADRIVSEIEGGVERDIDALEDDLQELERELQELEREITR